MKLLIRLNVKYDYSIDAILPFIRQDDQNLWGVFFTNFDYEIYVSPKAGQICVLVKDCANKESIEEALTNLPLIKEGFLEVSIYQFNDSHQLDSLFGAGA